VFFGSLADGASVTLDYAGIGVVPYDLACGSLRPAPIP
jgi:hypothetical protein